MMRYRVAAVALAIAIVVVATFISLLQNYGASSNDIGAQAGKAVKFAAIEVTVPASVQKPDMLDASSKKAKSTRKSVPPLLPDALVMDFPETNLSAAEREHVKELLYEQRAKWGQFKGLESDFVLEYTVDGKSVSLCGTMTLERLQFDLQQKHSTPLRLNVLFKDSDGKWTYASNDKGRQVLCDDEERRSEVQKLLDGTAELFMMPACVAMSVKGTDQVADGGFEVNEFLKRFPPQKESAPDAPSGSFQIMYPNKLTALHFRNGNVHRMDSPQGRQSMTIEFIGYEELGDVALPMGFVKTIGNTRLKATLIKPRYLE